DTSSFANLKTVIEVIDHTPIFDESMMNFAYWLSSYYVYPLGETFAVMLPALLKQGERAFDTPKLWQVCVDDAAAKKTLKTAKVQQQAFFIIKEAGGLSDSNMFEYNISPKVVQALSDKGLIKPTRSINKPVTLNRSHLSLTDEQQTAKAAIDNAIKTGVYQGILLHGITGSGKTEVYLQAMHTALQDGKQVLLLVPEIGLTPQSKERFSGRFNASIVVLHSNLNDRERLQGWQSCQNGHAQIIIATRSALFYPFVNLGLIIVDECHDSSYKQQDHLRYHACDVA
ncbi:MAG: DEAD/DEAH box helicase family protein, partial [Moraxella sp.]|nr:DEAD/DEAH box helicase family protein [Moraxella sp.]